MVEHFLNMVAMDLSMLLYDNHHLVLAAYNLHTISLTPHHTLLVLVSSKMKRIWKVNMNLLAELDRVCNKYKIKYHVCYGTLLGAVRHKGFIPWDDDIDVFIMRDDYNRLLKVAPAEIKTPFFSDT
jgi:hypothetical protein